MKLKKIGSIGPSINCVEGERPHGRRDNHSVLKPDEKRKTGVIPEIIAKPGKIKHLLFKLVVKSSLLKLT